LQENDSFQKIESARSVAQLPLTQEAGTLVMNQTQNANRVAKEELYLSVKSKWESIARSVMSCRRRALMEAQDIVHDAFTRGFVERWTESYDPAKTKGYEPACELDCSTLPDSYTADQVRRAMLEHKMKQEASRKLTGLKFWLTFKFRLFVKDEMRRKVQRPTLDIDYNRGREGKLTAVRAVSLEDHDVVARLEPEDPRDYLTPLSELEREVVEGFYLEQLTLKQIASRVGCHFNTVHAIKKLAMAKISQNSLL